MNRIAHAKYIDPLDHLWITAAKELGLQVELSPHGYAHADGKGNLCSAPTAELVPYLAATQTAALLWRKSEPSHMPVLDRPVIMGHVPNPTPRDLGHVIAIDTGAGTFPTGSLTAVILPERRFVGVR